MTKRWIVQGDHPDHGGVVLVGDANFLSEDKPVARVGDMVACPQCKGVFPIASGKSNFLGSNGQMYALEGDKTACGATLIAGGQTQGVCESDATIPARGATPAICVACMKKALEQRAPMLVR